MADEEKRQLARTLKQEFDDKQARLRNVREGAFATARCNRVNAVRAGRRQGVWARCRPLLLCVPRAARAAAASRGGEPTAGSLHSSAAA